MKDASHLIRKEIYDALNGNVTLNSATLPVYNVVPNNGNYPYIYIYSLSNDETDVNKDKYNANVITRVEVVTAFATGTPYSAYYRIGGGDRGNIPRNSLDITVWSDGLTTLV